jgi:GT2 family glycosyltransferase
VDPWPTVGISIPTHNDSDSVAACIKAMRAAYPGRLRFAIAANGCDREHLARMRTLADADTQLIELDQNYGYGQGANAGIAALLGTCDYLAVSNDDVLPARRCLVEMVEGMARLESEGKRPGLIGPLSNRVSGIQFVETRPGSPEEVLLGADEALAHRAGDLMEWPQIRGLFLLMPPALPEAIGGFDARFGIGNYEDDDFNLRARFAGFSLWVARGSFLYHQGSATFRRLGLDYQEHSVKLKKIFLNKWGVSSVQAAYDLASLPHGVSLSEPLEARMPPDFDSSTWPEKLDPRLVGRNDPCPCGSGKKYKKCHYELHKMQGQV